MGLSHLALEKMSIRLSSEWSVVLTSAAGGALVGCLGLVYFLRYSRRRKTRTTTCTQRQTTKKIKVYHTRTFRSARVAWIVEELGLRESFEFVDFNPYTADDDALVWYRTNVHPHATVPALVDENSGLVLIESGAICLYLARLHQQLTPDDDDSVLPIYYDWVVYAAATLDPCLSIVERNVNKSEEERDAEAMASAFDKTDQFARYFERHLENKDYICGKSFTVADIVTGYCVMWMSTIKGGSILADYPRVKAYLARLKARPTFAVAMGTPREWVNGPEEERTN